jgi:hypothetical protein
MLIIQLLVSLFLSQSLLAQNLKSYEIMDGQVIPLSVKKKTSVETSSLPQRGTMNLKIKVTKFVVTKTDQGPKVNMYPVCEVDGATEIRDLTGGGIVSEETFGVCESEIKGVPISVVLSGFVYDNKISDFSDESESLTRNFFAHLSLVSSEVIFGLGDFNLDTTRDPGLTHLSSSLSVDPRFGQGDQAREGFTARIRYTP